MAPIRFGSRFQTISLNSSNIFKARRKLRGCDAAQAQVVLRRRRLRQPIFGQRLTALRRAKGPSQTQLAELLDTTRKMIDYYERRADNPSLDFIQRAAEALDVSVVELLGSQSKAARGKPGSNPQLQLRLEQIRRLPRKEQEFVIRFIDTVLEKAQKA